jgi:hypothetical protein
MGGKLCKEELATESTEATETEIVTAIRTNEFSVNSVLSVAQKK